MDKPSPDQVNVEYEVGYGKPPKATQFKPGQSGNRKGRPKGAQNFQTVLENELNSKVVVTEGGRRKQVRKKVVIAKQLVNKAASGDLKATSLVMAEARGMEAASSASLMPVAPQELAYADQLTLKSIIARLRASAPDDDSITPVAATSTVATDQPLPAPTEPSVTLEPQSGASS